MSARALRRAQEVALAASSVEQVKEESEDSEEEDAPTAPKPKFNPFDLLSDAEEDKDDEEEEEEEEIAPAPKVVQQQPSKKKKAKAKAKQGSAKTGQRQDSHGAGPSAGVGDDAGGADVEEEAARKAQDLESIDRLVKELNLATVGTSGASGSGQGGSGNGSGGAQQGTRPGSLLAVDVRGLRGDDELRRIFGADIVESVDRQELAESAQRRRMAAQVRGTGARSRRPLKRGFLVTPKDHWPPFDAGNLSMEVVPLSERPDCLPAPKADYAKGEAVLYCRPGVAPVRGTVVQVDLTVTPPQYGVKRDGIDNVVFTEAGRLRPAVSDAPSPSSTGKTLFRYVYSPQYRSQQHMFEQCQATHDPNAIARLLQQAPYHVDSLLSMYDLYRHMGENAYAEDCLARALYCMEMAWHPSFDIASANCRLDFEVDENRALFTALFRHTQGLSRQGCHRTALECCKLLLAIEPEDPLGALMLMDYLSLRASKYTYLRDFAAHFEGNRSLALLPNYAFACALARLRQSQEEAKAGTSAGTSSAGQPSALELMVQAILLHPLVVPRLLAKLQEGGTGREGQWSVALGRKLFLRADDGGSASLSSLVNIYAERSAMLWKPPDALELLRMGAVLAAELADGRSAADAAASVSGGSGGSDVNAGDVSAAASAAAGLSPDDWACVRRDAFPSSDVNDYRHLRLHDFSDAVSHLPREELNAAMAQGGPDGVEDALAEMQEQMLMQQLQQVAQEQAAAGGGANAVPEAELRSGNPLMMLLRSLMPWVDAGQQPDYQQEGGGGGGAAQQ
ncbi:hypothetical protein FOA52_010996 [Chlamydomonas sp. UWO 241]|nr:hypothetical protein FOA52_010996 [Chlamydomonas sp. UWO 241]